MISRQTTKYVCFALISILYLISVPWYRGSNAPLQIWIGLPDWVAVALLCYVGVAILNAIAWTVSDLSDDPAGHLSQELSGGGEDAEMGPTPNDDDSNGLRDARKDRG